MSSGRKSGVSRPAPPTSWHSSVRSCKARGVEGRLNRGGFCGGGRARDPRRGRPRVIQAWRHTRVSDEGGLEAVGALPCFAITLQGRLQARSKQEGDRSTYMSSSCCPAATRDLLLTHSPFPAPRPSPPHPLRTSRLAWARCWASSSTGTISCQRRVLSFREEGQSLTAFCGLIVPEAI